MRSLFKSLTVKLLEYLARLTLLRYKPRIIAVTGSVGKTSTKDAIATVLSPMHQIRASQKSYNSELGVPLTILGETTGWSNPVAWLLILLRSSIRLVWSRNYPDYLILEVGADHPGDIERITRWLRPDIAIITQLSATPVHIEYFNSPEELFKEKAYLIKRLKPGGQSILNLDDQHSRDLTADSPNRPFLIGTTEQADLHASNYQVTYDQNHRPAGITFKLNRNGSSVPISIDGVLGKHIMYPVLTAVAVGLLLNQNLVTISQNLTHLKPSPGRMRLLPGREQRLLIDDSYNSSPIAASSALHTLAELKTPGRKICLLGDMRELGSYSSSAHQKLGQQAAKVCDLILTVGQWNHIIIEGALEENAVLTAGFDTVNDCIEALPKHLQPEDTVLIKGSQGIRLEKVVAELLTEDLDPKEVLVRQETQWSKR